MDHQPPQRGRKNFNNGGGARFNYPHQNHQHHYQNNHHHHHHSSSRGGHGASGREFYSTQQQQQQQQQQQRGGTGGGATTMGPDIHASNASAFINQGYRPNLGVWRNLVRRHHELLNDKNRGLREVDVREIEMKKAELENKERLRHNIKAVDEDGTTEEKTELLMENNESDANKDTLNNKKGLGNYEKFDCDAERIDVNRLYQQRERKLDIDMQKFFQDIERQVQNLDRRVVFDPRMMETELLYRDQQIGMYHQRILSLEEKNRSANQELEYFRHLSQQLTQSASQREHEYTAEKEVLIAKAKAETMAQLIRLNGKSNMWNDPFISSDPKLNLDNTTAGSEFMTHHPLLSSASFHAWVSDSNSPCLQPMPTFGGNGIMTDLRDRYEDVKCSGYLDRNEKTDWIMKMIRKVVMFYESHNMRVYEESLNNQHVSTLIWCPNNKLCPQKSEASFALGYGTCQLDATESALQQAYVAILDIEKKLSLESSTESSEDSSTPSPKSEETGTEQESTETDSSETDETQPIINELEIENNVL